MSQENVELIDRPSDRVNQGDQVHASRGVRAGEQTAALLLPPPDVNRPSPARRRLPGAHSLVAELEGSASLSPLADLAEDAHRFSLGFRFAPMVPWRWGWPSGRRKAKRHRSSAPS